MATVISQQSRMNLHAEKHPTSMPALDEKKINVGRIERILSALAGGLMVFNGLRKKSLGGAAMVAAGGSLLYR